MIGFFKTSFYLNIRAVLRKKLFLKSLFTNTIKMHRNYKLLWALLLSLVLLNLHQPAYSQRKKKGAKQKQEKKLLNSSIFSGLKFRSLGPAYASGRIADFAMNPSNPAEYYVGVAAGNVWKTENFGITWKPIFDKYGAWSIADVEIDPNNENVIWVGTGEYNSQRAIGYGDGVYVSKDRGKSFKNVGLKKSEHIGRIAIDPRNSHVYVAAQGPLWNSGGDRGLYKTKDFGRTWKKVLDISGNTGVTDVVIDPRNPNVVYCASYQRRRRVWTLINGGPESAIYKSIDAGETWTKLKGGLPGGDLGRIGLAISPVNPDHVYAIIELPNKKGGVWRTTDRGESWEKRSNHVSTSPQYYNRLYCDPVKVDRVYSMSTYTMLSDNGGKTWRRLGLSHRHVDDHALWIDPKFNNHIIIGGDGGIYESWDLGANWHHKENLPVTQFYRVAVDNSKPFYYVFGGTQDNNSMGGPSRNTSTHGVINDEWFVTQGGDGFQSRVDPDNPNIIYAQYQYGGLTRYDKQSGEKTSIQPQPPKDEAYRWNWNAPLIISPHSGTRLYFAANKLLRSDDRGNTWKAVSPDLTRQIDRNQLKVMGKIPSPDAVAKNVSTSIFGNITALDESRLKEGLIYVGTDDGLIQVTEDGGQNWRKVESVGSVPAQTYVAYLVASKHDENVVYATFDGRKNGDLKPHVYKSTDKGRSWKSISSNLPERGTVYNINEDHKDKNLLFVGTEFAFYFSVDAGANWVKLTSGLPVSQMRDLAIQERENDLVIATFGRGFYVLDNYAPLRELSNETLKKEAHLFNVKDALQFVRSGPKYGQGATYYAGKNPAYGAVFTYYIKDNFESLKSKRKKADKKGITRFPSYEELEKEQTEKAPYLLFVVRNKANETVRKLKTAYKKGIHRLAWDLRHPSVSPVSRSTKINTASRNMVAPGEYNVAMYKVLGEKMVQLGEPQTFKVVPLNTVTLPASDRAAVEKFQNEVSDMARAVYSASKIYGELNTKVSFLSTTVLHTPKADLALIGKIESLKDRLYAIDKKLNGNKIISKLNDAQSPSIKQRMGTLNWSFSQSTSSPTGTMKEQYQIIESQFRPVYEEVKKINNVEMREFAKILEDAGAPYVPGKLYEWE